MSPHDSLETLFARQDNCIPCAQPAPCNCDATEQCVTINRDCNTCTVNKCVPLNSGGGKSGVSTGAVAAAVVCSVIFLIAVVLVFLWYRRRARRLEGVKARSAPEVKTDSPARAEDVLNRPDPNEKTNSMHSGGAESSIRVFAGRSNTTINLDPEAHSTSDRATPGHSGMILNPRRSVQSNPFSDTQSIQTTSTGTQSNVIPIALVAPDSVISNGTASTNSHRGSTGSNGPARPARDPSLNLNMDPNASATTPPNPRYAASAISGMTNIRNSYMSTGSFASDLLSEAPVIVTPTRGTVKQVLGVVKAEVIRTPPSTVADGLSPPGSPGTDSLRPSFASRPSMRSPLAHSSFGPNETLTEAEEEHGQDASFQSFHGDIFNDEQSPYIVQGTPQRSPAPSQSTFGSPGIISAYGPTSSSTTSYVEWTPEEPTLPWAGNKRDSVNTQSQSSIISANISNATRVNVGLQNVTHVVSPASASSYEDAETTPGPSSTLTPARQEYRLTNAKLVSPAMATGTSPNVGVSPTGGAFEMQQRRAMEDMAAHRLSHGSAISSTSTRADSILEGFPFVPPSPISDRPARTPPRSPLAQQAFVATNGGPPTPREPPAQPAAITRAVDEDVDDSQVVTFPTKNAPRAQPQQPRQPKKSNNAPPPSSMANVRKMRAMSTQSQSSTVSNGLGSFPFQIDSSSASILSSGSESVSAVSTPNSAGRQRASLDTLALTSELGSYPLPAVDRNMMEHYPGPRR